MIVRRVTAFVIGLLLLDLTWVGGDRTCMDHPHDSAMAGAPAEIAHHQMDGSGDATNDASSEVPPARGGCASLASCAIAWTAPRSTELIDVTTHAPAIPATSLRVPVSGLRAPEPPPPKA